MDLRWGVADEAALDQQTLNICLSEVARCRRTSPRPNFIVLLGDRYGWQPPPPQIPADELEAIRGRVSARHEAMLAKWYRRDDNARPPEYVLHAREGEYRDRDKWGREERELLAALEAGALDPEKYSTSATHREIEHGALRVEDADEHVFCFFRKIVNLEALVGQIPPAPVEGAAREKPKPEDFVDLVHPKTARVPDVDAAHRLERLKAVLRERLPENVEDYEASWTRRGISTDHIGTLPRELDACIALLEEPLDPPPGTSLCVDVWRSLAGVILTELERKPKDPLTEESRAHFAFARERARAFTGREDVLREIAAYLDGDVREPLGIHGVSGSGKSAVVARAARQAAARHRDAVMLRFIGTTPDSSDGRSLLASLCSDVARALAPPLPEIPTSYRELAGTFVDLLHAADREGLRLLLFVDGLDQLPEHDEARRLAWLPAELPGRVRIVVSALEDEPARPSDGATVIDPLDVLRAKIPSRLVEIPSMTEDEGRVLLEKWLARARRDLTGTQRDVLLRKFSRNPLPLYLKLGFEEARRWRSYADEEEPEKLSEDVAGIIRDNVERLSAEENHGEVLVARSLAYLAAAKSGLSEDELLKVLSCDKADGEPLAEFVRRAPKSPPVDELPVIVWSRLYVDIERYLTTRRADGISVLSFYHRQLRQVVSEDYLGGEDGERRHRELAEFFGGQELELVAARGPDGPPRFTPNLRKMSELPYQQVEGRRWGELRSTLLRLEFLHAKARAGLAHDVVGDFELAMRSLGTGRGAPAAGLADVRAALAEFATAYNQELHAFLPRPAVAAQQIYNNVYAYRGFQGPAGPALEAFAAAGLYPGGAPWLRRANTAPETSTSRALERTLSAHRGAVTAVSVSPNGRYLASGGADGAVRVWQKLDGALMASLDAHEGDVWALAWLPDTDDRLLASAGKDGFIRVWNWPAELERTAWEAARRPIRALALVDGGGTIAAAGDDRVIRGFSAGTGERQWELTGHEDGILCLTAAGETHLVSGSLDRTVRTWQLDPARAVDVMRQSRDTVRSVAADMDGSLAVSGGDDRLVWTWNVDPGRERRAAEGHQGRINGVAVGVFPGPYDGEDGVPAEVPLIVSGGDDETIRLWELASARELATLHGHTGAVNGVAAPARANWFASGGNDGTLRVWASPRPGGSGARAQEHRGRVNHIGPGADPATFVSGSHDHTVKVWERADGALRTTLRGHLGPVSAVLPLPDGGLVTASADHTVKVWDLDRNEADRTMGRHVEVPAELAGQFPADIAGQGGHRAPVTCLEAVDDRRIASGARDGTVILWDTGTWDELELPGARGSVARILVCPSLRWLIAIGAGRDVAVWDLESPGPARLLTGHTARVSAAAVPAPNLLVTGGLDGTVRGWHLGEREAAAWVSDEQRCGVTCLAAHPPEEALVSGGKDGRILVWDVTNGSAEPLPQRHERPVRDLRFDSTGGRMYSVGEDQWLLAWDPAEWRELAAAFVDGAVTTQAVLGSEEVCVGTRRGGVALFRLEDRAREFDKPPPAMVSAGERRS